MSASRLRPPRRKSVRRTVSHEIRPGEADKLEAQVRRIQKEIETQKRKLEETKSERPKILEEEKFILEYVKKAQANVASLRSVLEKISAADKAAEEVARAAAAAAAAAKK